MLASSDSKLGMGQVSALVGALTAKVNGYSILSSLAPVRGGLPGRSWIGYWKYELDKLLDVTPKECTLVHQIPPYTNPGLFRARTEVYCLRRYFSRATCPQAYFENLLEFMERNFYVFHITYRNPPFRAFSIWSLSSIHLASGGSLSSFVHSYSLYNSSLSL